VHENLADFRHAEKSSIFRANRKMETPITAMPALSAQKRFAYGFNGVPDFCPIHTAGFFYFLFWKTVFRLRAIQKINQNAQKAPLFGGAEKRK